MVTKIHRTLNRLGHLGYCLLHRKLRCFDCLCAYDKAASQMLGRRDRVLRKLRPDFFAGRRNTWTAKFNSKTKKGKTLTIEHRKRLSIVGRLVRSTYAPIWNKGLTKDDHPSLVRMAASLSKSTRGVPKPQNCNCFKRGRRRFWFYGRDFRTKMRSTWEVAYAHYLDSLGVKWLYESTCFVLDKFSYTPDFWIPVWHTFVEIKGFIDDTIKQKLSVFRHHYGAPFKVLMGEDLQRLGILDTRNKVVRKERRCA
jgi:hypothetical protein